MTLLPIAAHQRAVHISHRLGGAAVRVTRGGLERGRGRSSATRTSQQSVAVDEALKAIFAILGGMGVRPSTRASLSCIVVRDIASPPVQAAQQNTATRVTVDLATGAENGKVGGGSPVTLPSEVGHPAGCRCHLNILTNVAIVR